MGGPLLTPPNKPEQNYVEFDKWILINAQAKRDFTMLLYQQTCLKTTAGSVLTFNFLSLAILSIAEFTSSLSKI